MPIELQFHDNGVVIRESGIISDNDFMDAVDAIYAHKYPDGLHFQLADLSSVTEFSVSADTMRSVGTRDLRESKALPTQHLVVVAPPSSYTRLMNKVWEIWAMDNDHAPSVKTNIVNTFPEAIAWLETFGIQVK
jgi:hypothetical protein